MPTREKHIINIHTSTGTTAPTTADLRLGEIAVQHTPNDPAMWIKVGTSESSDVYEKFIGETEILELISDTELILGSGYTYSGLPYVNSATSISDAYSALTKETLDLSGETVDLLDRVAENEYVIAVALNDFNDRINEISGNTGAGAEPLSAAVISLSASVVSEAADITALSSATHTHVNDTDVHVTTSDKTTWNGKQDAISDLSTIRNNALSGASAYTRVNSLSSATVTLSGAAHTKITELSAATEAHITDGTKHLPAVTSSDNGKILQVEQGGWEPKMPVTVYGGTPEPASGLGINGDIYLQTNPVVLYETDGTTGLLGHNQNDYANRWQLENLDMTPYSFIRCYFKCSTTTDATGYTPAVVVEVPLDTAAMGTTIYCGGQMVPLPFNRNREYLVSCAVDGTKTKFQVIHQNTLWDVTTSDANNGGRYLYKIEGYV